MRPAACAAHNASFRDPNGFIFELDGELYRQVNRRSAEDYDRLLSSGLYDRLVTSMRLVAHTEVDGALARSDEGYKVLHPARVPFISYPYEWCFGQLKDAALLTLDCLKGALASDMVLKDASAYNVQFVGGKPILIDTLSFTKYEEGAPWVAYRQFCQHFLAPLALMAHVDPRLNRLLAVYLDGVPLSMASAMLPWRTRWSLALGLHVHAHARSQAKYARDPQAARKVKGRLSKRQLEMVVAGLEMAVHKLSWTGGATEWADYYDTTHNYGEGGLDAKASAVASMIDELDVCSAWDLGANVGRFSRLVSARGVPTIAWDIDPACVEANYQQVKTSGEPGLLPLLQDLTNPSGGIGWAGLERASLAERGPVDLVLALGLIHHLVIGNNVPVARVARYFSTLCRYLIVEFVPKEDSQVRLLLATREDVFDDYRIEAFSAALSECFRIDRQVPIAGTRRTLFLATSKARP